MAKNIFTSALAAEGMTGRLEQLARSIFQQESGSGTNPAANKVNYAGASGPMQIIPSTFKSVADKDWDIANPEHNMRAGLRYIKEMDKLSGGDSALTAAGYYGGPGGLRKAKAGIAVSDPKNPNAPTTLEYAKQVTGRMGKGQPVLATGQETAVPVAIPNTEVPREGGMPAELLALDERLAAIQAAQANSVQAQAPQVAQVPEWEAMRQAMPETSPVASMGNYGAPMTMPQFVMPQLANNGVNFSQFKSLRGRA